MEVILVAISNSSPLVLFAHIGRLDLLRQLFGEILIPPAVQHEVVVAGSGLRGAAAISAADWIRVRAPTDIALIELLASQSDRGEAEVVALGVELGRQVPVILDDRQGRRLARDRGLNLIGSAGLLVLAKQQGLLPAARPELNALRAAGLRLGEQVYEQALAMVNETPPKDNAQEANF